MADMLTWAWASSEQSVKDRVLENVALNASTLFKQYMNALEEALGLPEQKASTRLNTYSTRSPAIWKMLSDFFPKEYDRQQRDFRTLLTKSVRKPKQSIIQSPAAKLSMAPTPQPEAL